VIAGWRATAGIKADGGLYRQALAPAQGDSGPWHSGPPAIARTVGTAKLLGGPRGSPTISRTAHPRADTAGAQAAHLAGSGVSVDGRGPATCPERTLIGPYLSVLTSLMQNGSQSPHLSRGFPHPEQPCPRGTDHYARGMS
jgi:hypothetical protein